MNMLDSRWDPCDRWTWHPVSIVQTGGPQYHREASDTDQPYEPPRQRLGFAPAPIRDPLTWDGDNA